MDMNGAEEFRAWNSCRGRTSILPSSMRHQDQKAHIFAVSTSEYSKRTHTIGRIHSRPIRAEAHRRITWSLQALQYAAQTSWHLADGQTVLLIGVIANDCSQSWIRTNFSGGVY
jgi:hypothetical protein